MTDERTIETRLRAAGYGHRRDIHSGNDGRHTVYRLDTGEVIGRFDALASLDVIKTEE